MEHRERPDGTRGAADPADDTGAPSGDRTRESDAHEVDGDTFPNPAREGGGQHQIGGKAPLAGEAVPPTDKAAAGPGSEIQRDREGRQGT